MSLIDLMARIFGDGPWTLEAATRNALRAAAKHHRPYEAVEVEPGRWVAKPVRDRDMPHPAPTVATMSAADWTPIARGVWAAPVGTPLPDLDTIAEMYAPTVIAEAERITRDDE